MAGFSESIQTDGHTIGQIDSLLSLADVAEEFRYAKPDVNNKDSIRGTTIICVRHKGIVAIAGDGQVTMGDTVLKQKASKIRTLYKGKVLAGFSGATSDAFALFSRFGRAGFS